MNLLKKIKIFFKVCNHKYISKTYENIKIAFNLNLGDEGLYDVANKYIDNHGLIAILQICFEWVVVEFIPGVFEYIKRGEVFDAYKDFGHIKQDPNYKSIF